MQISDCVTLKLECWSEELSPAQLAAYEKAEKEHNDIKQKLDEIIESTGGEKLFLGEIFSAFQIPCVDPELEKISKNVATAKKEIKTKKQLEEKARRADRKREYKEDVVEDESDDDYKPLSKRMARPPGKPNDKRSKEHDKKARSNVKPTQLPAVEKPPPGFKPSELTAIGGLTVGDPKKKEVVDLTKEDKVSNTPDSREITFNKLQGKTFPSLVVLARPSLKTKDSQNDRPILDSKVKSVLMHTAAKFTEWLIQQGLVRSEQECIVHPGTSLKLGMYSDATKFPFSGGYVWISECCPMRFVSVFSGSLFEGAPQQPSVLLKLIYHWACQTNVQNVVQWVKVDNLYVKGFYTWLRAVCTLALHQHMNPLGGHGKRIEVGVISLGTTSQDGNQRQVKVEVLGVLDPVEKIIRLRAIDPPAEGERNYKKRFTKILEPLNEWVSKDSQILTDVTVDRSTLVAMGYRTVVQVNAENKASNANIMDYLRRIVPRMFQNTLSLLSRQIIQQFLDELVWREWYGTTPCQTFDNIVAHISEQTRLEARDTIIPRLNKVAGNPFKNWSQLPPKVTGSNKAPSSAPSTSGASAQKRKIGKTNPDSKRKRTV